MRFAVKDHMSEGSALIYALLEAGHEITQDAPVDLFLIDLDPDIFGYRELIDFYYEAGAIVLQYPHGATANLGYDSLYEPYDHVHGQLSMGSGEGKYLRALGITRPTREIGWAYCKQFPFRKCKEPKKVVFAPTHPNGDGSMLDHRRAKNAEVFDALVSGGYRVTCRLIGSLEQNGLPWVDGVRYVRGQMDFSTAEIDGADLCVAGSGTYPALAIARGCPTIMYGQLQTAVLGIKGEPHVPLARMSKYAHIVRYPLDFEAGAFQDVVKTACANEKVIQSWKADWIGDQFDPKRTARVIEDFVADLAAQNGTREAGIASRSAEETISSVYQP